MKISSRTILSVIVGIASSAIWMGVWSWYGMESLSIDFVFSTIGVGFATGWFLYESAAQKDREARCIPHTTKKTRSWTIRNYFSPVNYDSLNTIKYGSRILLGRCLFFFLLIILIVVPAIAVSLLNQNYVHAVYFTVLLVIATFFAISDLYTIIMRKKR